jgi:hypothetical protein
MVMYMSRGLSGIVGLILILIALVVFASTTYNILNLMNEYMNINSMISNKQTLRSMVIHLTEGYYIYYPNGTLVINLMNGLPEPLLMTGYIILFPNGSYHIVKTEDPYIIPPLTTSKLTIGVDREPLGVFIIVLIRDEITHIVVKKVV